jgi:class 3 adenylate cyclase
MPSSDERKPVTVLFADLAGATELATRHDAEALRALLSAFFEEMRHQIEAFGGTVEKFAGDAVLAVFGVPARLRFLSPALTPCRVPHYTDAETCQF